MRVAVFTNQFPSRVNTFFVRDMRALMDAGCSLDIFPLYPLDASLWQYVPDSFSEAVFARSGVHHVRVSDAFARPDWSAARLSLRLAAHAVPVLASAARFGLQPVAKSQYAALKALAWARRAPGPYDHVLSYWGNYAATAAQLFHRLIGGAMPFTTFLHAGTDLYRDQVYLAEKLQYADNIIVVCEFNRAFIERRYPAIFATLNPKIHLHHLGLDLDEYRFDTDRPGRYNVIGVGTFEEVKGFAYLVEACAQLRARNVPVTLELVGDGPRADALKASARSLGIADHVRFRGWLTPEHTRHAISQATILVHPSSGLGDAVPTVIKEAMALGTPVVASDLAGIPELLDRGRCGLLVPPRDGAALADAMEKLLGDPALAARHAVAARRRAEDIFDLRKNGPRLAALLQSSVRRPASPGARVAPSEPAKRAALSD